MRSFEQRIAEIDRRSEKIFKGRKRRRLHMLIACIPLVLCIGLYSVFILPAMMPASSEDPGANGGLTEDKFESLTCSISRIEVSGVGVSLNYTEPSDVLLISDQLFSYAVRGPETNGSAPEAPDGEVNEEYKDNGDGSDISGSIADSATEGYTITLVMHEGGIAEYYLAGNTLENRTINETYTLTQKQLNELKDLLGIPHQ